MQKFDIFNFLVFHIELLFNLCYSRKQKGGIIYEKGKHCCSIKKIMDERGIRQVDILNLAAPYCEKYNVKMNKSDLSQYCSGKTEPNQDKLFVLGAALNVNEAWLMGYDVPMERNDYEDPNILIRDAELEEIDKILESAGYSLCCENYDGDFLP